MILPVPVVLLLLVINVSADDGARIGVADVEVVAVVVVDVVVLDKISKWNVLTTGLVFGVLILHFHLPLSSKVTSFNVNPQTCSFMTSELM